MQRCAGDASALVVFDQQQVASPVGQQFAQRVRSLRALRLSGFWAQLVKDQSPHAVAQRQGTVGG